MGPIDQTKLSIADVNQEPSKRPNEHHLANVESEKQLLVNNFPTLTCNYNFSEKSLTLTINYLLMDKTDAPD